MWALTQAVHTHIHHETNLTRFYRPARSEKAVVGRDDGHARKMKAVFDAQKQLTL